MTLQRPTYIVKGISHHDVADRLGVWLPQCVGRMVKLCLFVFVSTLVQRLQMVCVFLKKKGQKNLEGKEKVAIFAAQMCYVHILAKMIL